MTSQPALSSTRRLVGIARKSAALATKRPAIGIATNGLSSIGNLLLAVAVARSGSVIDFAQFAVAFSVYVLTIGLCRATVTDSILAGTPDDIRRRLSTQQVLAISGVCAILAVTVGITTQSHYLTILGATLPGLSVYEHIKVVSLGVGNPCSALIQESLWTLSVVMLASSTLYGSSAGITVFSGWAVAGCAIGCLLAARLKYSLRPRWITERSENDQTISFGLQYLAGSGIAQLTTSALAAFAEAVVVAAIRAGGTILAPTTLILTTAKGLLIPYLARFMEQGPCVGFRRALLTSVGLVGLVSPVCVALLYLPDQVGTMLLGASWQHAQPILPALAGELISACITAVAFAAHRVHGAGRRGLVIEAAIAPLRVIAIVWAGHSFGAQGAALAMLFIALAGSGIWWWSYWRIAGDQID